MSSLPAADHRFRAYLSLIRFDRPIGSLLLLWPTLTALWIASEGVPDAGLLLIFAIGVFLARSAGCVINDLCDRNLDGAVARTANRPLVSGSVRPAEALGLALGLAAAAFALVLHTNALTVLLSFAAAALALAYPLMKRVTQLPQLVLGVAFSWGIPMSFAAVRNELPAALWLLFLANLLWTVAYDTEYAMVDRDDDRRAGIKSTAILFGRLDRAMIGALQVLTLAALWWAGQRFSLGAYFQLGLLLVGGLFGYQQHLIRSRDRERCFQAFLHNNYVGMAFFAGTALHYGLGGGGI